MFDELPEPQPRVLTPKQRMAKSRYFVIVLNAFVLAYNFLHKFLMPLYLGLNSHDLQLASLDWWWLYHVALAWALVRHQWDDGFMRGLLGIGLGGITVPFWFSFQDRGWTTLSLWVTSGASLIVLLNVIALISKQFPLRRKILIYSLGFLLGLILQLCWLQLKQAAHKPPAAAAAGQAAPAVGGILFHPEQCGQREFSLRVVESRVLLPELTRVVHLNVRRCGFSPVLGLLPEDKGLLFSNDSGHYLNIKVMRLVNDKWVSIKNLPMRAGANYRLDPEAIAAYDILLIASESDPGKGVTLLLRSTAALSRLISAQVQGISINRSGLRRLLK